eukprot:s1305_g17.t1
MLHVAAYHRRMGVVACLLAQHANPEVSLQPGALRPLMVAAFQGSLVNAFLGTGYRMLPLTPTFQCSAEALWKSVSRSASCRRESKG